MEKINYSLILSEKIKQINILSYEKMSIEKDVLLSPLNVFSSINIKLKIIIENQKITKVDINTKNLEKGVYSIEEICKQIISLIKEEEEKLIKISEKLKIKEICNLNNLEHILTADHGYYFRNSSHEYLTFTYALERNSNILYLYHVEDKRPGEKFMKIPKVIISEEIIKKNNKFRLMHLLRNYSCYEKKG